MISLARPKQDDSRREELGIVELVQLGEVNPPHEILIFDKAMTYRLNKFMVVATKHNMNWPGTDSPVTFAVEGYGWKDTFYGVLYMWGFFDERDCYDFLTGTGKKSYPIWDRLGIPGMCEPRLRLGISDAYVRRYVWEADC